MKACVTERQTTVINSVTLERQYQPADVDRGKARQRARSSHRGGSEGDPTEERSAQGRKINFDV